MLANIPSTNVRRVIPPKFIGFIFSHFSNTEVVILVFQLLETTPFFYHCLEYFCLLHCKFTSSCLCFYVFVLLVSSFSQHFHLFGWAACRSVPISFGKLFQWFCFSCSMLALTMILCVIGSWLHILPFCIDKILFKIIPSIELRLLYRLINLSLLMYGQWVRTAKS